VTVLREGAASSPLAAIADRVWEPDDRLVGALGELDGDLVVLGAAGKMGVSLGRMAAAALRRLPGERRVIAVSRFSDAAARAELEAAGVQTIVADLADPDQVAGLPEAANVVYMVGRKFGTSVDAGGTWFVNAALPGPIARKFRSARIVAFSSGNVYPFVPAWSGGADERTAPAPVGEYAQSCLGRERVLSHLCAQSGTPLTLIRLNYAIDCRYGVLTDLARAILAGAPIDVAAGAVNVVWQGDANRYALAALGRAGVPATVLNVTGPETASVRWLAEQLGARLDREPEFVGEEPSTALLSNAGECFGQFGYPAVTLGQMLDWTAEWVLGGGELLDKPTHFAVRTGRY
jgi:nucleoside-diphosphate-sugar epimerase